MRYGNISEENIGTVGLIGASGLIGGAFLSPEFNLNIVTLGRAQSCDRYLDLGIPSSIQVFADVDTLIYAAGVRDEDFVSDPESAFWRSSYGAKLLFENAADAGVRSVVYISTAHVYGELNGDIDETYPVKPQSDYASCHFLTERILYRVAVQKGLRIIVLRPNAVFGLTFNAERFSRWNLVPFLFPRLGLETRKIKVRHPSVIRNFVSSQRIANAACRALSMDEFGNFQVINVIGHDHLTMEAYATLCAEVIGRLTGRHVEVDLAKSTEDQDYRYKSCFNIAPMPDDEVRNFVEQYIKTLM